jgi:hypothetical protein
MLMKNGSMPLMDIALECGLANQSHLPDVFRQIVGATPSEFRRESSEHFPASLVVSGKRAFEIWTMLVCVNGMIVDQLGGKSVNSNSLIDEELKQPFEDGGSAVPHQSALLVASSETYASAVATGAVPKG